MLVQLLFLFTIQFSSAQSNKEYRIQGILNTNAYDDKYIYLSKNSLNIHEGILMIDSTLIQNGNFLFKGTVLAPPALYNIMISTHGCWLVLEPGVINFTFTELSPTLATWCVNGTPLNEDLFKDVITPSIQVAQITDTLSQVREKDNLSPEVLQELSPRIEKLMSEFMLGTSSFIKKHIEYPVGEYFLLLLGKLNEKDMAEIEPKLSEEMKKKLIDRIAEIEKLKEQFENPEELVPEEAKEGKVFIDFEGKKTDGEYIALSQIIKSKKLILLDFWASWCVPCLREMPLISELYAEYKDKGLEIIGVSIDNDENMWKRSIEKHNLIWTQVIDPKVGTPNSISGMYGINTIPQTILINEEGQIIARGLRGNNLRNKIHELSK